MSFEEKNRDGYSDTTLYVKIFKSHVEADRHVTDRSVNGKGCTNLCVFYGEFYKGLTEGGLIISVMLF